MESKKSLLLVPLVTTNLPFFASLIIETLVANVVAVGQALAEEIVWVDGFTYAALLVFGQSIHKIHWFCHSFHTLPTPLSL